MRFGLIGILVVAAILGACSPETEVTLPRATTGFSDITPDGRHGLLVGERMVDDRRSTVAYLVEIDDLRRATYHVVDSLTGKISDIHFVTDTTLAYQLSVQASQRTFRWLAAPLRDLTDTREICGEPAGMCPPKQFRLSSNADFIAIQYEADNMPDDRWSLFAVGDEGRELPGIRFPNVQFGDFARDGRSFVGIAISGYDAKKPRQWTSHVIEFDLATRVPCTLTTTNSCFGKPVSERLGGSIYFLSSMPEFEAANVWSYDPQTTSTVQLTTFQKPEYVAAFDVVRDSLLCLVRDPSREESDQYRYEVIAK